MNLDDFFGRLRKVGKGKLPLDAQQEEVLRHKYPQPLWIIAGPGTGKTHTLTWLTLKRVLVDGIPPDRLLLTTFTRKAAVELRSRLILFRQQLIDVGSQEAASFDPSELQVGNYPARAVLVFLGELADDSLWSKAARHPERFPGLFHEVPFNKTTIGSAMSDFRKTVREIEREQEKPYADQWAAPKKPPDSATCDACEIRFNCARYRDAAKQRKEPL